MVIHTAFCAVNTIIAWGFALFFIRRKRTEIYFNVFLCAAVQGLLCCVAYSLVTETVMVGIGMIWFLFMTVIVQLQKRDGYGNAVIAFGLAQSAYAVFAFIAHYAEKHGWGILFYMVAILVFLLIACTMGDKFPDENWREYDAEGILEPGRINIRPWHIYAVVALGCGTLSAPMLRTASMDGATFMVAATGIFVLFWSEIGLLILMHAYRKEHIEVLLD